jgi:hypothetical protein
MGRGSADRHNAAGELSFLAEQGDKHAGLAHEYGRPESMPTHDAFKIFPRGQAADRGAFSRQIVAGSTP